MKKILLCMFILIEEILFYLINIEISYNITYNITFSVIIALAIDLISNILPKKLNKIFYYVITVIITIIFITYTIFYKLLGSILSLNSIINGIQEATDFSDVLLNEILKNWYNIIILLFPFIILIILSRKINFEKKKLRNNIIEVAVIAIIFVGNILSINILSTKNEIYTAKNLYYNINNMNENLKKFGLLTAIRLDIQRTITGFKEKTLFLYKAENGTEKVIDVNEYNMINYDFEKMKQETESEEIKEILEYVSKQEPTNKNEFTGKFRGKNLIVFIAESFSNLAIREDLTPTLYKMANTGYVFKNFYTPLFPVSTADGEYLADTSLLPVEGIWSIENVEGKTFPYSYANVFNKLEYKTSAYHNYDYDYYKRDKYFTTMGYDTYLGKGNGLENDMDFSKWPASDYEMVKNTISTYIDEDHFMTYYLTISGHINYDKSNAIVVKNWDLVKDLPYSDASKAYLATQIELDKALQELLEQLEEKNKLNDTIIMITGDHYPYGLKENELQELADEEIKNNINKFHMPFILYDAEQNEKIECEKYACSLDVLPTILNLFGIQYDSRLLMGRDIFSDAEPLIIFSDRSFITEKGIYDSWSNSFDKISSEDLNENEYIKKIKEEIYYKYRYSRLILLNDFYKMLDN